MLSVNASPFCRCVGAGDMLADLGIVHVQKKEKRHIKKSSSIMMCVGNWESVPRILEVTRRSEEKR